MYEMDDNLKKQKHPPQGITIDEVYKLFNYFIIMYKV